MKIYLKGIEAEMFLGIYEHEKKNPQKVRIDIELNLESVFITQKNDLQNLIDYDFVLQTIKKGCEGANYDLIEDLIANIYNLIKDITLKADSILIKVFKFNTHNFLEYVAIEKEFTQIKNKSNLERNLDI